MTETLNANFIDAYKTLIESNPVMATTNHGSEKCDNNNQCISSYKCWFSNTLSDCQYGKYSSFMNSSQDFMDIDYYGSHSSLLYEWISIGRYSNNLLFCNTIGKWDKLFYCTDVKKSNNCFWCVNLKEKQYCIFNKQYTKEEYEREVWRIIWKMQETGERWEFFHPSLSLFGYNETVANEYFPLTREEAIARWYKRQDNNYDPVIPEWTRVMDWRKEWSPSIPLDKGEEILKSIFLCEISWRPYRIIKQELDFYRKHNLSLPKKHPDVRHEERMKLRPGRTLYLRTCDKTGQEMLSVYPPDYPGKVYSEKAYQDEIFG